MTIPLSDGVRILIIGLIAGVVMGIILGVQLKIEWDKRRMKNGKKRFWG